MQTFRLLKLRAYPFGIKALLHCTHISPIPYRSHGPDTLRSGQWREHWVLYKSILRPQHFAAPGTPGKIIKRLARSSLHHHFFLRWELKADKTMCGGNVGSTPFSLQSVLNCWDTLFEWILPLKSWNCHFLNCLLPQNWTACNLLPTTLQLDQLLQL